MGAMSYADTSRQREVYRHRQQRNRQHVWNWLCSHPCVDCDEADPVVLEFDHVRGDKSVNISRLLSTNCSLDKLQSEIDKCDVRCANCHRKVTYLRGDCWRSNAALLPVPGPLPELVPRLNKKYTSEQQQAALQDYLTSGESQNAVAARHGMTQGFISYMFRKHQRAA